NQGIGYTLTLSSARLHSLSRWRLNDPRQSQVDGSILRAEGAAISLDSVGELVAQSEIDFRTLKQHLRSLLAEHAQCSVASCCSIIRLARAWAAWSATWRWAVATACW